MPRERERGVKIESGKERKTDGTRNKERKKARKKKKQ